MSSNRSLFLASEVPLVMLEVFWTLLVLGCVEVAVITIVLIITVTGPTVTAWWAGGFRGSNHARREAWAHQGPFPPSWYLVLKRRVLVFL